MYTIATLEDLRRRLNLGDDDRGGDDELRRALHEASHLIESATGRRFCPRLATLEAKPDASDRGSLILPDDLLELHGLRGAGGSINLADASILPGHDDEPASILQLKPGAAVHTGVSPLAPVSVSGVWGWHDRWSRAWRQSGDQVGDAALSATASTITVADSDASDEDGAQPRFQVGHLLRIEGERLRVVAIDRASNRLRVLRGVGGWPAASHPANAKIETYAPPPAIRDLTLRFAELLVKTAGPVDLSSNPLLRRMRRLTA